MSSAKIQPAKKNWNGTTVLFSNYIDCILPHESW